MAAPRGFSGALRNARIAAAYLACWLVLDYVGFLFEAAPGVSPWYPPHGFSLAFLLVFGLRFVPLLVVGPLIAGSLYWLPGHAAALAALSLAIAAGYGAAAWAIRRAGFDPALGGPRDVSILFGVGVVSSAAVALLAVLGLAAGGAIAWPDYPATVLVWWVGDTLGIFGLGPFFLLVVMPWARRVLVEGETAAWAPRWRWPNRWRVAEAAAGIAAVAAASVEWGAFAFPPLYLVFIPVVWSAWAHGARGTAVAVAFVNVAVLLANQAAGSPVPLLDIQMLMVVLSVVGQWMGSTVTERRRRNSALVASRAAEDRLARRSHELAERVKELHCLYNVTHLLGTLGLSVEDACQSVAEALPSAFQYPEWCGARIRLYDQEYATDNHADTEWRLSCPVEVGEAVVGEIGVAYVARNAAHHEPLFMAEEHDLLSSVAAHLGQFVERREFERQLRQAHKLEIVGQLTGGIAHDFNNLLTIILGNLAMLRDDLHDTGGIVDTAEASRALALAHAASLRAAELTSRLLAFSRLHPLAPRAVDLKALLADLALMLQLTFGESVEVETRLAADVPDVFIDPVQLEAALLNLAVNARDAMPKGGRLVIEAAPDASAHDYAQRHDEVAPGRYARLSVTDRGTGIPAAHLDRIFEPFFTTKDVGKGSGLGLSMVYGFVKQSGGHIKVYSELGQGSCFTLYLPEAQPAAAGVAGEEERLADVREGQGETVLVVEDEPDVVALVARLLERAGYRVLRAATAVEALDLLGRGRTVDLLLADLGLPGGVDGVELAAAAREIAPALRVLFMSGHAYERWADRGIEKADGELLVKPFRREMLLAQVGRALRAA